MAIVAQPTGNPNLLVRPEGHRDWSSGLFSCTSDCGSCLCTWLCFPCALCRMANRLGECCLVPFFVPLVAMRTKIRTMGGIKGTMCTDCCAVTVCAPFAICQMQRELDHMGL